MSSAASIARSASSAAPIGAPHCAITASPMNLSSVPPCLNTISTITVKYSLSSRATSSGFIDSESAVKPRMSLKSTATVLLSPPSLSCVAREPAICAASRGAKKRSKLPRTIVSCRMRSANWLFSSATAAMFENAMRNSRSSSPKRCVRRDVVDVEHALHDVLRADERRAHRRAHALHEDRLAAEALVLRRIVGEHGDLLVDDHARDRLRHRPCR